MFELISWFFSCSCQLFIVLFNFHFRSHEIHHIRYWVDISIIIVFRHLLIHKYELCLVETKVIKRESFLMILLLIDDPNQTLQKSRMGQWNFCLRQLLLLPLHGLLTTYTYKKTIRKTISAMSKRFFCKKMIIAMPGQISVMHHVSVFLYWWNTFYI